MIGRMGDGVRPERKAVALLAVSLLAGMAGGCGMSQITSSLGGGVLSSKKQETAWTPIVTEESMLAAARTNSDGPMDTASANGCPSFQVQTGDRYVTYYDAGRIGDGLSVTYRGEITKTARECQSTGSEIIVKYGVAGRALLGPKGKAGTLNLPALIEIRDRAGNKLRAEKISIVVSIAKDKPLAYFSLVRDISVPVKPGMQPKDYNIFVGFDRTATGAS